MKEGWLRVIVPVLFFVLKEPVSGLLACWPGNVSGNIPGGKRGLPF